MCQLTADSLNIPVIAGPVEATALGNIVLQLVALGELKDVSSGRKLISGTESLKKYCPVSNLDWDSAYKRFIEIIK